MPRSVPQGVAIALVAAIDRKTEPVPIGQPPTPTPSVTVASAVPDPWDWSLDSVIALINALASVTLAGMAVAITIWLAVRDHREQLRQRRARLAAAVERYVRVRERGVAIEQGLELEDAAAADGFGPDAPPVDWAFREAESVMVVYRDMPRGSDGAPHDQRWWQEYGRRRTAIRRRFHEWVASGSFDETPLPDLTLDDEGRPVAW